MLHEYLNKGKEALASGKTEEAETLLSKTLRDYYDDQIAKDPSFADTHIDPDLMDKLRQLLRPSKSQRIDQQWHNIDVPRIMEIAEGMGLKPVCTRNAGEEFINVFGEPISVEPGFTYIDFGRQPNEVVKKFWTQIPILTPEQILGNVDSIFKP